MASKALCVTLEACEVNIDNHNLMLSWKRPRQQKDFHRDLDVGRRVESVESVYSGFLLPWHNVANSR